MTYPTRRARRRARGRWRQERDAMLESIELPDDWVAELMRGIAV